MRPSSKVFLTYQDASVESGLPVWRLRKWAWAGRLPVYRPEGKTGRVYIAREDLLAFMEQHRSA